MNQSDQHKLTAVAFVLLCGLLAAYYDSIGAYICMSLGIVLYGFVTWLEKYNREEAEKLAKKFKEIDDTIQALRLGKAIGR